MKLGHLVRHGDVDHFGCRDSLFRRKLRLEQTHLFVSDNDGRRWIEFAVGRKFPALNDDHSLIAIHKRPFVATKHART